MLRSESFNDQAWSVVTTYQTPDEWTIPLFFNKMHLPIYRVTLTRNDDYTAPYKGNLADLPC